MNKYSLIEILAYFSRFQHVKKPEWRKKYTFQLSRVRSCHSRIDGGVKKSFYSLEGKCGNIADLVFYEEELIWKLMPSATYPDHVADRVLTFVKRHKHTPSRAHRIIPYRFEIIPKKMIPEEAASGIEPALVDRMQPYRFQSGKILPTQVIRIVTKHLENVMVTKHLHYVIESDSRRFFHLVFILDEFDWRFIQEVDGELLL